MAWLSSHTAASAYPMGQKNFFPSIILKMPGHTPLERLHIATLMGEKIYRMDRKYYGKPAGTLFIMKEVSRYEDGRHYVKCYRKNWPKALQEAAMHLH